jgi:hypothetical protein
MSSTASPRRIRARRIRHRRHARGDGGELALFEEGPVDRQQDISRDDDLRVAQIRSREGGRRDAGV